MIKKGIDFRAAPHLTFRHPNEGDVDSQDRQVEGAYFILLRWEDCKDPWTKVYDQGLRKEAPQFQKLTYSRTNMAYGRYRRRNQRVQYWVTQKDFLEKNISRWEGVHCNGEVENDQVLVSFPHYYTCPVYWIEGGQVYRGTIKTWDEPQELKKKAA